MLLPVLLEMPIGTEGFGHAHITAANEIRTSATTGLAAVAIHTAAMLLVAGAIAVAVYEWVGLEFLRRGWINLDWLWVLALVGAGLVLLITAL